MRSSQISLLCAIVHSVAGHVGYFSSDVEFDASHLSSDSNHHVAPPKEFLVAKGPLVKAVQKSTAISSKKKTTTTIKKATKTTKRSSSTTTKRLSSTKSTKKASIPVPTKAASRSTTKLITSSGRPGPVKTSTKQSTSPSALPTSKGSVAESSKTTSRSASTSKTSVPPTTKTAISSLSTSSPAWSSSRSVASTLPSSGTTKSLAASSISTTRSSIASPSISPTTSPAVSSSGASSFDSTPSSSTANSQAALSTTATSLTASLPTQGSTGSSSRSEGSSATITLAPASTSATTTTAASTTPISTGTPAVFAIAPYPSNLAGTFWNFTGTSQFASDHFLVWNTTQEIAQNTLRYLEGTYDCFVVRLGWRNPGVPFFNDPNVGPFYKVNQFVTETLPVMYASGVTTGDYRTGLGFTWLLPDSANSSGIVAHEFGHVMNYGQQQWWNQSRAQGWAEVIAQYVDDSYVHSPMCAASRALVNDTDGWTLFNPFVTVSLSYKTLVDGSANSNQYQAWPFLSYLSNNPDNYDGLGNGTLLSLFRQYRVNSNETPLHTLTRVAAPRTSQQLVARYWARMAWIDLGDDAMQRTWNTSRGSLDYNNTYAVDTNVWRVQQAKQPQYMGSNIIPLNMTGGEFSVRVDSSAVFTATLAIRSPGHKVNYLLLSNTTATKAGSFAQQSNITLSSNQSVMLVVTNTPDNLLLYDTWNITGPVATGLDYNVTLVGATPRTSLPSVPYCIYWQAPYTCEDTSGV